MSAIKRRVVFLDTPDGPVVVEQVGPEQLADARASARACQRLSLQLGNLPVVQRCVTREGMRFGGPVGLRQYAADPAVDDQPAVDLVVGVALADAA